jgi:hypothetical protein
MDFKFTLSDDINYVSDFVITYFDCLYDFHDYVKENDISQDDLGLYLQSITDILLNVHHDVEEKIKKCVAIINDDTIGNLICDYSKEKEKWIIVDELTLKLDDLNTEIFNNIKDYNNKLAFMYFYLDTLKKFCNFNSTDLFDSAISYIKSKIKIEEAFLTEMKIQEAKNKSNNKTNTITKKPNNTMNQIPPEFISMMAESNRQQANFNKLMEEIKTKPKSIDSVVDTTPNTISRLNHSDDFYKNIINKKDEDENDT